MKLLNYREMGSGPALICLHGLYGYGRNWLSLARHLQEHYRVILPDLRNHGSSPHSDQWNYPAMARDLKTLVAELDLDSFSLLGHSMGGKLAMHYALETQDAALFLNHLIIVDIAPKAYAPDYHRGILKLLSDLPLEHLTSRKDAESWLKTGIPERAIRQFLTSNLQQGPNGWYWQFNWPVFRKHIESITGPIESANTFKACPVLFISGARSDYILPTDRAEIKLYFPAAECVQIPEAGHWLHIEQPQAFLQHVRSWLES